MLRTLLALCAAALAIAAPAQAAICERWSAPEKVGTLDLAVLPETSGLAVSRAFANRLYHHNDGMYGSKFYVSDGAGQNLKAVTMTGFVQSDMEDVAVGICAGAASCLYVGDIGDNAVTRASVAFAVMAEKQAFAEAETPLRIVRARYPDGAHNAEGFAIHPNGDLFLMTKVNPPAQTQIFKLTRAQLAVADGSVQTFTEVGKFDFAALMSASGAPAGRAPIVTGLDISADGKRGLMVTYDRAVEFGFDLAQPLPPQAGWQAGRDFRVIVTATLPQMEGVAYTADGKGFVYDSEFMRGGPESPIYRQTCEAWG